MREAARIHRTPLALLVGILATLNRTIDDSEIPIVAAAWAPPRAVRRQADRPRRRSLPRRLSQRHGGTWRLLLTGAAVGFLLYAASQIVNDLGANSIINPVLAAWPPPIVGTTFGATALLYQEDG